MMTSPTPSFLLSKRWVVFGVGLVALAIVGYAFHFFWYAIVVGGLTIGADLLFPFVTKKRADDQSNDNMDREEAPRA
jgi:hypothetical protein